MAIIQEIILYQDFLIEGIKALQATLNKAIELELQITDFKVGKGLGFLWNEYCNGLNYENQDQDIIDLTEPFHIWSTDSSIGTDTWIYNVGELIYFEISSTYRWHFDEPTDLKYKTYEQFKEEYAVIDVFQIDKNIALDWLEKCKDILNDI